MPKFYRVLKASKLGDPYTPSQPNAKPLQSFWCQVEDINLPVMMSKQVPNEPSLTEGHYGVLEETTSKAGNPYYKFTSMMTPQGTDRPRYDAASAPVQQDPSGVTAKMHHDLEQRVSNLELLLATPKKDEEPSEPVEPELDKAALEDIFGGEVTIQDIPTKED